MGYLVLKHRVGHGATVGEHKLTVCSITSRHVHVVVMSHRLLKLKVGDKFSIPDCQCVISKIDGKHAVKIGYDADPSISITRFPMKGINNDRSCK